MQLEAWQPNSRDAAREKEPENIGAPRSTLTHGIIIVSDNEHLQNWSHDGSKASFSSWCGLHELLFLLSSLLSSLSKSSSYWVYHIWARFYHKCTHHHDETKSTRMVNMIAVDAATCLATAELHKSPLHVHTVASPSSMHFSAPCIQQARNRTTPLTTCLMQPLLLIRSLHSSHCLFPSEVSTGLGLT